MWIALACIAGLGALVNLMQVITSHQVIRPAASQRSASQLRRESAAVVLVWSGMALLALHVTMVGFPVEALGFVALMVVRRPARRVAG